MTGLEVLGYTPTNELDRQAQADWVGPQYFATLGVEIVQGRDFSAPDATAARATLPTSRARRLQASP